MDKYYYIYILSSLTNVTVYTGVTNDLKKRVYQHKNNLFPHSFTAKYNVHKLVYFEIFHDVRYAIKREKQIKRWSRKRKNALITDFNPAWADLYDFICGVPGAAAPKSSFTGDLSQQ